MLDRAASNPKNKPDELLNVLKLRQGQVVADIGAGGGYFSLRFAEIVGKNGRVFAADTNRKFLELINEQCKEKKIRKYRNDSSNWRRIGFARKKPRSNLYAKCVPPSAKQSRIFQEIRVFPETQWKSCYNRAQQAVNLTWHSWALRSQGNYYERNGTGRVCSGPRVRFPAQSIFHHFRPKWKMPRMSPDGYPTD